MLAADFDRSPVEQWLSRLGAQATEDPYGLQAEFAGQDDGIHDFPQIYPLSDLGLIQITGEEAVKFLQGQLTNDLEKLEEQAWRWYGFCSAKGRMQLSALGFKRGQTVSLICSRSLSRALAKRLGMFVMRSKAKVSDASDSFEAYGLTGPDSSLLKAWGAPLPLAKGQSLSLSLPSSGSGVEAETVTVFCMNPTDSPNARCLLLAKSGSALWSQALALGARPANSAWWRSTEVANGEARIVPATHELFVPQMINFESIGGVDFKKGCYPGQEVVARSQYLGKLKRRMFIGEMSASGPDSDAASNAGSSIASAYQPAPAQDVWSLPQNRISVDGPSPAPNGEPCGQVVLAAARPGQAVKVLFEAQTGALEQGPVGVQDSAGHWHVLTPQALPYSLLEL
jgi:tRNA-modifying protein YgfZ